MNDELRFFIQWSQAKKDWYCAACRQHSKSSDYDRMVIQHKADCRFIAMIKTETHLVN